MHGSEWTLKYDEQPASAAAAGGCGERLRQSAAGAGPGRPGGTVVLRSHRVGLPGSLVLQPAHWSHRLHHRQSVDFCDLLIVSDVVEKNIDLSSKSNPLCRRGKNYDASM